MEPIRLKNDNKGTFLETSEKNKLLNNDWKTSKK